MKLGFYFYSEQKMKQKIAAFMMGLWILAGGFWLVSAADEYKFWVNPENAQGINGIAGTTGGTEQKNQLETVIKNAINWVLWILSLIVLILLLWWGFQMVTANWDDKKFGAGMTILKQAAIWLWFIAVSWLIVSMIFRVLWQVWATPSDTPAQ